MLETKQQKENLIQIKKKKFKFKEQKLIVEILGKDQIERGQIN